MGTSKPMVIDPIRYHWKMRSKKSYGDQTSRLETSNLWTQTRSKPSDQIAPIVELLRKRQREEIEEANIRQAQPKVFLPPVQISAPDIQTISNFIRPHSRRFQHRTVAQFTNMESPSLPDYICTRTVYLSSHWWFSGKIGRCHWKIFFLDIGQPRVRFPADAFLPVCLP
jgi:hypothetical protein